MCGIAGFCFTPDSCFNGRELARTLLLGIEERGKDSAGFAAFRPDGTINGTNLPLKASEFVKTKMFRSLDDGARTAILHTRLSTKGSPQNLLNNHPVFSYCPSGAAVAAVHNGMIWNDDEKFAEYSMPRYGQVDSEILPAMIARFGSWNYSRVLGEVEGSIATAWLDERVPNILHCARAWDSPMVVATIDTVTGVGTPLKGVIFASTLKTLGEALKTLGLTWLSEGVQQFEIGEGEHFRVDNGEWDKMVFPFALPDFTTGWKSSKRTSSATVYRYPWWDGDEDYAYYNSTTGEQVADPNAENKASGTDDSTSESAATDATTNADAEKTDDYVSWWSRKAGVKDGDKLGRTLALANLADRMHEPGYVATLAELLTLSSVTDDEVALFEFDMDMVSDLKSDYMVHMECCSVNECHFADLPADQSGPCPRIMSGAEDLVDVTG